MIVGRCLSSTTLRTVSFRGRREFSNTRVIGIAVSHARTTTVQDRSSPEELGRFGKEERRRRLAEN